MKSFKIMSHTVMPKLTKLTLTDKREAGL